MTASTVIRRVRLRNYRSIAACDVALGPITVVLGPTGAGKSNFVDALAFVSDALTTSLHDALHVRGGFDAVLRRSTGHPSHLVVRLDFRLADGSAGHFGFTLAATPGGGCAVLDEEAEIVGAEVGAPTVGYAVDAGAVVRTSEPGLPAAGAGHLLLGAAGELPALRPIRDALAALAVHDIDPRAVAAPQAAPGQPLRRDGGNAAEVLRELGSDAQASVNAWLAAIVPGIVSVGVRSAGPRGAVEFRQRVEGHPHPWTFSASAMSEGTLRALGALLAVHQCRPHADGGARPMSLVGLRAPDRAMHPAAATVLRAALRQASRHTQIVVTGHGPEVLDDVDLPLDAIVAVDNINGVTYLGAIDAVAREAVRDRLVRGGTAGWVGRWGGRGPADEGGGEERQMGLF